MPDRKDKSGRQQSGMNRGTDRQQSQQSNVGAGSTRKQPQTSRTHRSQQR
jgi:hypothetical protein